MDAAIKKIPYGMTDFERIILENYYYVDKTQYIAKVEKVTSFFFFVRPRRFGKSLFLNMLGLYYDINQKDKFEKNKEFFNKNLYIEMIIEGINHSIFGNYGLQNKDGITENSNLKQ